MVTEKKQRQKHFQDFLNVLNVDIRHQGWIRPVLKIVQGASILVEIVESLRLKVRIHFNYPCTKGINRKTANKLGQQQS